MHLDLFVLYFKNIKYLHIFLKFSIKLLLNFKIEPYITQNLFLAEN